jgi:hypothetical protein
MLAMKIAKKAKTSASIDNALNECRSGSPAHHLLGKKKILLATGLEEAITALRKVPHDSHLRKLAQENLDSIAIRILENAKKQGDLNVFSPDILIHDLSQHVAVEVFRKQILLSTCIANLSRLIIRHDVLDRAADELDRLYVRVYMKLAKTLEDFATLYHDNILNPKERGRCFTKWDKVSLAKVRLLGNLKEASQLSEYVPLGGEAYPLLVMRTLELYKESQSQ